MMVGYGGTSKTGKQYHYYICKEARKKRCDKTIVGKKKIEDRVIAECLKLLTDENIKFIAQKVAEECNKSPDNLTVKHLKKAIREADIAIENLWRGIEQGQSVQMLTERLNKRQAEKEELEEQLAIEQNKRICLSEAQILAFLDFVCEMPLDDVNKRRAIINILVHSVYLYDNHFTETFGMGTDLSEMTLEELWELFPIFLVAHDDRWKDNFNEIKKTLTGLLADRPVVRISHIGSTAIQGIWAKNIVDVMVEISQSADIKDMAQILEQNGFTIMSSEANRISLNKGYTENGFADKVYHIHLRYAGDNDELYFRDYLNEHPDVAKEYEALKLRLWKQYEHNRDAYTDAKTDFISKLTAEARKEYGDRYSKIFRST